MTRLVFYCGSILRSAVLTLLILLYFSPSIIYSQVISPRISITSSQGASGITVHLKCTDFSRIGPATIHLKTQDGSQSLLQSPGVSQAGSFEALHSFPAGQPQGKYLLWATDTLAYKW